MDATGAPARRPWPALVAVTLASLCLALVAVRRAVWGAVSWTDWALPLCIILNVGISGFGWGSARPRWKPWLVAANLVLVGAVLASTVATLLATRRHP